MAPLVDRLLAATSTPAAGLPGNAASAAVRPITKINDPAFQAWMKSVQALPAEKQVEAVSKKLMELNPGFDGKVSPSIQNGVVIAFRFVTDNVTNVLPVRRWPGCRI